MADRDGFGLEETAFGREPDGLVHGVRRFAAAAAPLPPSEELRPRPARVLDAQPLGIPVEQVRLAATAYNHGTLWRSPGTGSLDRIRAVTAEEKFPLPNLFRTRMRYYSYGDLAARYYAQVFNQ